MRSPWDQENRLDVDDHVLEPATDDRIVKHPACGASVVDVARSHDLAMNLLKPSRLAELLRLHVPVAHQEVGHARSLNHLHDLLKLGDVLAGDANAACQIDRDEKDVRSFEADLDCCPVVSFSCESMSILLRSKERGEVQVILGDGTNTARGSLPGSASVLRTGKAGSPSSSNEVLLHLLKFSSSHMVLCNAHHISSRFLLRNEEVSSSCSPRGDVKEFDDKLFVGGVLVLLLQVLEVILVASLDRVLAHVALQVLLVCVLRSIAPNKALWLLTKAIMCCLARVIDLSPCIGLR